MTYTVHAASLDDSSRLHPQIVTYAVRGHTWDFISPALPQIERMPSTWVDGAA